MVIITAGSERASGASSIYRSKRSGGDQDRSETGGWQWQTSVDITCEAWERINTSVCNTSLHGHDLYSRRL